MRQPLNGLQTEVERLQSGAHNHGGRVMEKKVFWSC
jgi:hypothetical protein